MSALKRNLKIVFNDTTSPPFGGGIDAQTTRRFQAKSLDGGTGWGVWDKMRKRFLKDREVAALSEDDLRKHWSN